MSEKPVLKIGLSAGQSILAKILAYKGRRQFNSKNTGTYEKLVFEVHVIQDSSMLYTGLDGEILLPIQAYPQLARALKNGETCIKVTRNQRGTDVATFPLEFCVKGGNS